MTYYPDLSPYTYSDIYAAVHPDHRTVNVGWLERGREFERGAVPPEYMKRLRKFCESAPSFYHTNGFHTCEFCKAAHGIGEIRVIGSSRVFAAPVMILHYVAKHEYLPPRDFLAALLTAPLPGTPEFDSVFPDPWRRC